MTTVSSILSIGLLPANLLLYTYLTYGVTAEEDEESILEALNFKSLFITLGIVLAAICSGLAAGYRWDSPQFHVLANRFGSICGLLLIVFSLFLSSGGDGSESTFWNQSWPFYIATAFPCLVGISLANVIARSVNLSPPETVAIAIECCYQNTGIATSVAITMFDDREERAQAVAVPLFYGVVEAVAIGIYCVWAWKWGWTKAPADENFCVMLTRTYEIEDDEDDVDDESKKEHPPEQRRTGEEDVEPSLSIFDNDFAVPADAHLELSHQSMVVEQGFWGTFFPPVLRRVSSNIALALTSTHHNRRRNNSEAQSSGNSQSTLDKDDDGFASECNNGGRLRLPSGSDDYTNRNRFVSADYTVETATSSQLSSPTSPEPHPAATEQRQCSIVSLTIPEVEHSRERGDDEESA